MTDIQPAAAPEEPPKETDVEIHKPKPVHNWREFLSEIGVVVLGICIALSGERVLEWLQWRGQIREAREVISEEMTYNLVGAIGHIRALGCVEQRLDTLSRILDEAARTGSLPPVGHIGEPVRHSWRSGAWDSVVASQTAAHFPPEQLAALSSLYKRVQRGEEFATRELEAWSYLYAMVGPGRRLDPASEADLRKALSVARDMGRTVATTSVFVVNEAAAADLPFTPAEQQRLADAENRPLTGVPRIRADDARTNAICDPIGAVPPTYGDAPSSSVLAAMSALSKSLPHFGKAAP
jgi:hypothetical protein